MEYLNKLSEERKGGISNETIPEWFITPGYQLFREKYLHQPTIKDQYRLIADTVAKQYEDHYSVKKLSDIFFSLMWKGWLSPSTPILSNTGTNHGFSISCSGQYIGDSIEEFYSARRECAILTKYGFGTSAYLGDIRPRGSLVKNGFKASGVVPLLDGFRRDMHDVAQGAQRRGAWAGYLPIEHGDFHEVVELLHHDPSGRNIGWVITDNFIKLLDDNNEEAILRYQKALKVKMITGKGYFFFVDKANRHRPICYSERNLKINASNLCGEIMLHSSEDYTYTCCLSSMNVSKYDEWVDTDAVFYSILFLYGVALDFIEKAKDKPGLEKAVAFTRNSMALGLGQCGIHTYFQSHNTPFDSLEAQFKSTEIAKYISEQATDASYYLASVFRESPWSKGTNLACTHLTAIAPTKSTALIMGGVSEGISPDPGVVYTATTAAGEVTRITPAFLNLIKYKGIYTDKTIKEITNNFGSIQKVTFLNEDEKAIFKTAFEMDQHALIRMAAQRQNYIDQGQSINLFFGADSSEKYISEVHRLAFKNENILSLYYCYSNTQVSGSKDECTACQ